MREMDTRKGRGEGAVEAEVERVRQKWPKSLLFHPFISCRACSIFLSATLIRASSGHLSNPPSIIPPKMLPGETKGMDFREWER